MNKLSEEIWHGIFGHNAYAVVAQKTNENKDYITWAGLHMINKYKISAQSHDFIQLASKNEFCIVMLTIKTSLYENNDGLNTTDFKDYVLFCFDTENKLYEICDLLNIDASKFKPPWRCEYPFY